MNNKNVPNEVLEVAARIREMREIAGLHAEEMAEKTNLTVDEYRAYESGTVDLPFTFIHKCALAFGIGITDILEGHSASLSSYAVTRKGEGIRTAKEAGIEVVVTDHHALPAELPPADALVNSAFEDDACPSRYLCGAAMAFKLIAAIEQQIQGEDAQELLLYQYGDLVAIATLADVVPLTGENRTLARLGLEVLAHTDRPGLVALAENAKAQEDPPTDRQKRD